MSITIYKEDTLLLLEYHGHDEQSKWTVDKIKKNGHCTIQKTFTFFESDLYSFESDSDHSELKTLSFKKKNKLALDEDELYGVTFVLAKLVQQNYFKFNKETLGTTVDVYIDSEISITPKVFQSYKNFIVFQEINKLIKEDIYIRKNSTSLKINGEIPYDDFKSLLKQFPNKNELHKYISSRISNVLGNYFSSAIDGKEKYENFLNKKIKPIKKNNFGIIKEAEKYKYEFILSSLKTMINGYEQYNEKDWQNQLLEIILLMYPKYIEIFKEVAIKDPDGKNKFLDYVLLDERGNLDIVEIKKPNNESNIMGTRYRGNFIPSRELVGSIMQVEKYIFYLNNWGKNGQKKLSEKYKNQLPSNMEIKIINPSGLIILGRSSCFSEQQAKDFEIVRRKYKHITDILTYDEIINNLERLIENFSAN